ncbi:DUF4351 domain-containing protein [Laspinema olomoucense]|uniref:DUF4351 domain-containing protein n=1 Tax=Laspinema olomoucense TaxID=3231600 RepID=UPI0021BADAD2|nr:DUF4351 domain-containing protein [Laspinema sp. D3a]MCT7990405.1 DUF4351 domain-containing protein [Laspinema sp. D3a]
MTRFIYDQFTKQYIQELLKQLGQTETSKTMASQRREIDIFFTPNPENIGDASHLGLLGRLATTPAVFEPFSNPVKPREICSCLVKLLDIKAEFERQSVREKRRLTLAESPRLWMMTPTASAAVLADFGATLDLENFPGGVYFLPKGLQSAIIVLHQLPPTPETLWLRILGTGKVQKQALQELYQLPPDNPTRETTLELLYNLREMLEARQNLAPEERELIMELSPLYLQRLQTVKEEGIQQGQRSLVESLLQVKFGTVDAELSQIIEALIEIPPLEQAQLILQLSREELLARFSRDF